MLGINLSVVGRILVRVLPVTQPRDPLVSDRAVVAEALRHVFGWFAFYPFSEPARDLRVVPGGPLERRERQAAAGLLGDLSLSFEGRQYFCIVFRRGDDCHGSEVLRGGPQHGGS